MNVLRKFDIPFRGLSEGQHDYSFEIDDNFFAAFEGAEITGGKAVADVTLTKGSTALALDFVIRGEVMAPCDRCLEDCAVPVEYDGTLNVKFGEGDKEGDGDVIWLERGESELNVAQYIYESIVLSLPYQKVHPEGECDRTMLERLGNMTEEEFMELSSREDMQKMGDNPQWRKLLEVKEKLENEEKIEKQ